jgi:hypothetical protein
VHDRSDDAVNIFEFLSPVLETMELGLVVVLLPVCSKNLRGTVSLIPVEKREKMELRLSSKLAHLCFNNSMTHRSGCARTPQDLKSIF